MNVVYPIPNEEVSKLLSRWGSILRASGEKNSFRINAYFKAAGTIKNLAEPIHVLIERGDKISGVGEKLVKKLTQLFETGKINEFEQLAASSPDVADFSEL